jgi:hypothetical protein
MHSNCESCKMKINNRFAYPETIVQAIKNDGYNKGNSDYSATELIKPARIRALEKKYADVLETDVDDQMFLLYGKMGHEIVERAGMSIMNMLIEKRFFMDIDGKKVSAQIDSLSLEADDTLIDWKFTTVFGFKLDTLPKPEWIYQLNIQAELLRTNGLNPKKLQIWGLLRDWRPGEKKKDPKMYPNKAAFHTIQMMTSENIRAYIKKRIKAHEEALIDLPECSEEDHWKWRRCQDYCGVKLFCDQYKEHLKSRE